MFTFVRGDGVKNERLVKKLSKSIKDQLTTYVILTRLNYVLLPTCGYSSESIF